MTDPYREWDGAYVMGSLSPGERREYERHLSTCADCAGEVAALAGISGILAAVPPERATSLVSPETRAEERPPPSLWPGLLASARRSRRWARVRVGALVAAVAAVAAALALLLPSWLATPDSGQVVALTQTVPSPITAEASLHDEPWGTRIELVCWYAQASDSPARSFEYALYVTDRAGGATPVARWHASAGSRSTPVGTTHLARDEIGRIDVRLVDKGLVLLEARP
ncbi:MAG TPA: zf-HC2 domain-containing protein [Pseudonocardiaceae bacterium]